MPEPLPTPKKLFDLEDEALIKAGGRSRQVPAAGDRDSALLALLCAILALGALAVYKLANAIASACWACG